MKTWAGGGTPEYWWRAVGEISGRDPVMAALIRRHSGAVLRGRGEAFPTLARAIVGQQISVKAADSVWARLAAELGGVSAATVVAAEHDALRACGLSARKAEYLADLAAQFASRRLRASVLAGMDDEAVIGRLTQIRGIGRWTAEMFLIFNLLRPDVLPVDDLGLLRAAGLLYFDGETPARPAVIELAERWQPWRTVATWYLWRSLDPVPVEY